MNRAELFFKLVDVVYHRSQNCIRYDDVLSVFDLPYGDDPLQKLDIYYKNTAEKLPVLFNIHGGGFVAGDKKHRLSIGHIFANSGWFVVNINHRLSPKNFFPDPLVDCFLALNMLNKLSNQYNIDLNNVVLTGDSSGGYFAVHMIAAMNNPDLYNRLNLPICNIKPTGVMGLFGPYDLLTAVNSKIPFGMVRSVVESFLGIKTDKEFNCLKTYKYLNDMAPASYVNNLWCPTLLIYAKQDFFCTGHAEILYDKLKESGVYVTEVHSTQPKDNHCYHLAYKKEASKIAFAKMQTFLSMIKAGGPTETDINNNKNEIRID